jgi:hypothetical protein
MKEKVKKLFLSSSWSKKQLILAVLVLVGLGLILPTSSTQAIGWGWLANPVAIAIAIIVLQFLVATTSAILWLATSILSWVTSENFISLPYISEGIVEIGWPLCRDFANMALVIFLVIIGLATALRIRDYEAKKALPVLIIVALLVNFSPVICGFFIDAANIVMNWFLEGIKEVGHVYEHFFNLGKEITDKLGKGDIESFGSLAAEGLIIRPLIISVFNVGAAFIIFLFSFIFILRYIALWALVILSPLAFVSYILPVTKRFWNMWWNQFVQWTTIGITMGFFLYLGFQLLGITTTGELQLVASDLPESAEAPNPVAWLLNSILPYFVVLAFLGLGFFLGLSSGAAGAKQILTGMRRGGRVLGAQTGKWAARTAYKAPGRAAKTYKAARRMGLSRARAFGVTVFNPKRFWKRWSPVEVKIPPTEYKQKFTKGGEAKVVAKKPPPWTWDVKIRRGSKLRGSQLRSMGRGIKKAWEAATKTKRKKTRKLTEKEAERGEIEVEEKE